jgi:hypothetical protein
MNKNLFIKFIEIQIQNKKMLEVYGRYLMGSKDS